jgi:chromosomal replication initiation ATPase DnaA
MLINEAMVQKASELFKVHPRDLISTYRFNFIVRARFAMYLALRQRGWSYPKIGRLLKRDHSSVVHGVKRAQYMVEKDPDFAAKVQELTMINIRIAEEEQADD